MILTLDMVYPMGMLVLFAFDFFKDRSMSPESQRFLNNLQWSVIWGYGLTLVPRLLLHYEAPLLVDENSWTVSNGLATTFGILNACAVFYKSRMLRVISVVAFLAGVWTLLFLEDRSVWRKNCPKIIDRRRFKEDANASFSVLVDLLTPMQYCNESSRFTMCACNDVLVKALDPLYQRRFNDMDYCATYPGFIIAKECLSFLLLLDYQEEFKPRVCLDVVREEAIAQLNCELATWEPCFANPYLLECMEKQEDYRQLLQKEFNGTRVYRDMHFMIELEREKRERAAGNFSHNYN